MSIISKSQNADYVCCTYTYIFSASIQRNNMIIITGVITKVCVRLSVCSESLFSLLSATTTGDKPRENPHKHDKSYIY